MDYETIYFNHNYIFNNQYTGKIGKNYIFKENGNDWEEIHPYDLNVMMVNKKYKIEEPKNLRLKNFNKIKEKINYNDLIPSTSFFCNDLDEFFNKKGGDRFIIIDNILYHSYYTGQDEWDLLSQAFSRHVKIELRNEKLRKIYNKFQTSTSS